MSDLRVSYAAVDDGPDTFVSQQMQIASVRVVGAESEAEERAIFEANRQDISRFFRFCDQQHRLSGRGHSHYRVSLEGLELRYVNDAGQPIIFATPSMEPPEYVVLREPELPEFQPFEPPVFEVEVPEIPQPDNFANLAPECVVIAGAGAVFDGTKTVGDLYSPITGTTASFEADKENGGSVLIVFSDNPEDANLSSAEVLERIPEVVRPSWYETETVPVVRFPREAAPRFVGFAEGYVRAVLNDDDSVYYPEDFIKYDTPQPLYEVALGLRGTTTTEYYSFVRIRENGVPGENGYDKWEEFHESWDADCTLYLSVYMWGRYSPPCILRLSADLRRYRAYAVNVTYIVDSGFFYLVEPGYRGGGRITRFVYEDSYGVYSPQLYDPLMELSDQQLARMGKTRPEMPQVYPDGWIFNRIQTNSDMLADTDVPLILGSVSGGLEATFRNYPAISYDWYTNDGITITSIF